MSNQPLTDETVAVIKVGEFVVDEETGEILEMPADFKGDRVEWLIRQGREAMLQIKTWESALYAYKAAIRPMLEEQDFNTYRSADGSAVIRSSHRESASVDKLREVAAEIEMTLIARNDLILLTAKTIDPKLLRDEDPELAKAVIEVKDSSWVQFNAARKQAPKVTKERVDA